MKTINFITGNKNKLAEVQAILGNAIEVQNRAVDVPEIQGSIEEIAKEKCRKAAEAVQGPALTEDTALEFNSLKGLPGPYMYDTRGAFDFVGSSYITHRYPFYQTSNYAGRVGSFEEILSTDNEVIYSKWFLEALGHDGLNKLLDPYEDKSIVAVCTFAFSSGPGEEPILFQGKTEGRIVPARGPANFGWDPIFEYEGKTFAEMDKDEKNLISHRYKALTKLKQWLVETYP
ncbi:RdgB/HAM1 family non-canonical purine NTP pyrophosphatase [Blastomyces percursus]|uniref:Inosine triphosphate pyrophosphatase n=1 Tax=Blastomyces percursus TaxID=1658174 RepID=A0A1J9RFB4_9EURO|nr:RdgB/HAM1 family non-canonical purine NTP pyrophosphatase [Blastomyces percursus]